MNAAIPPDALCQVEGCGHRNDDHTFVGLCDPCEENQRRGFKVEPTHEFVPRRLAGGAYTADAEREAYEKALRGE